MLLVHYIHFTLFSLLTIKITNKEISKKLISKLSESFHQKQFTTLNNFQDNLETKNAKLEANIAKQKPDCRWYNILNAPGQPCLQRMGHRRCGYRSKRQGI